MRTTLHLFKVAGVRWYRHHPSQWGAALAYYTLFALAPLLLVVVAIAGQIFSSSAAQEDVERQLALAAGPKVAPALKDVLQSAAAGTGSALTIFGLAVALFGAFNLFSQLQTVLNFIWDAASPDSGWWDLIREQFLAFAMVVGVGGLVVLSLLSETLIRAIRIWSDPYTGDVLPVGWKVVNWLVPFLLGVLLFVLVYKLLPEPHVDWADAGVGGLLTALLFYAGSVLVGLYLGRSSIASAYGAAGSLAMVLVWMYYSAQIVLLGAAFTKEYTDWRRGRTAKPAIAPAVPAAAR